MNKSTSMIIFTVIGVLFSASGGSSDAAPTVSGSAASQSVSSHISSTQSSTISQSSQSSTS